MCVRPYASSDRGTWAELPILAGRFAQVLGPGARAGARATTTRLTDSPGCFRHRRSGSPARQSPPRQRRPRQEIPGCAGSGWSRQSAPASGSCRSTRCRSRSIASALAHLSGSPEPARASVDLPGVPGGPFTSPARAGTALRAATKAAHAATASFVHMLIPPLPLRALPYPRHGSRNLRVTVGHQINLSLWSSRPGVLALSGAPRRVRVPARRPSAGRPRVAEPEQAHRCRRPRGQSRVG